jgi:hypothetical protein
MTQATFQLQEIIYIKSYTNLYDKSDRANGKFPQIRGFTGQNNICGALNGFPARRSVSDQLFCEFLQIKRTRSQLKKSSNMTGYLQKLKVVSHLRLGHLRFKEIFRENVH